MKTDGDGANRGFAFITFDSTEGMFTVTVTLLMAQWVGMEALKNENHASHSCFFYSLGAARQVSGLESASKRVVTHRHALSAWFFQLPCLPIEPLGGLENH